MPYKVIIPQEPALNLPYVEAIAQELRLKQPEGSPDLPFIIEEEHRHSDRIHVTVIWDRWAQIGLEERSHIIFEAYKKVRGPGVLLILTRALGLTRADAKKLGKENGVFNTA